MGDEIGLIKNNLTRITDAWNHYFLENKLCQSKINFNAEVKTNYYGDILSYFSDTLDFLGVDQAKLGRKESIFNSIGLLQIIYAQQDLIDELLHIFKLPESVKEDKNPNRNIRNELVGHPIRRQNGELISSVFFGNEFEGNIIHYVLYSKEDDFKFKEKMLNIETVIESHFCFLIKYTEIILSKIKNILNLLKKKLRIILTLMSEKIKFNSLLTVVQHNYERIFEENILFDPAFLKIINEKYGEHPRYENIIKLFTNTLREFIHEIEDSIDNIVISKIIKSEEIAFPKVVFKIVKNKGAASVKKKEKRYFDYEFSKLFEKHPIFGVDFFVKEFSNDKLIMDELNNMIRFSYDDLEYYSSYGYLKIIMTDKGFLNRRF